MKSVVHLVLLVLLKLALLVVVVANRGSLRVAGSHRGWVVTLRPPVVVRGGAVCRGVRGLRVQGLRIRGLRGVRVGGGVWVRRGWVLHRLLRVGVGRWVGSLRVGGLWVAGLRVWLRGRLRVLTRRGRLTVTERLHDDLRWKGVEEGRRTGAGGRGG